MKRLLPIALVVVAVAAPATLRAQSPQAPASVAPASRTVSLQTKPRHKQPVFRHPSAAQRGVTRADLVAVKTASGKTMYARKRDIGTQK